MECINLKGIYRDLLIDRYNSILYDSGWTSNTIVYSCRTLLAAFMYGDILAAEKGGIQYLAVGKGNEEWDKGGPPNPTGEESHLTDLTREIIQDLKLAYLDEQDKVVNDPKLQTSRLQITVTLKAGEPANPDPYPLREFGLFGRFKDKDYMINYVRHPVIHKDNLTTLTRTIRLYF